MILYDFDYLRAISMEHATAELLRLGEGARVSAGGTDLLPNMRVDIVHPSTLIGLGALEPALPARQPDGSIRIDALTRLATLEQSELIRDALPMLAKAAGSVAGHQIRQMGTLGGNLCQDTRCMWLNQKHDYQFKAPCYKRGGDVCYPFPTNKPDTCWSVHMSDTAPALIALNADIEIRGKAGIRRMAVENLYTGSGLSPIGLAGDEIIQAIIVPPTPERFAWGYCKSARRGGMEFGVSVMAVALSTIGDSAVCGSARIAIGAVRERPLRLTQTEQALEGALIDEAMIAEMAIAAAKEINPLPHHGFTKAYIRDDFRIKIRRVLEVAVSDVLGRVTV